MATPQPAIFAIGTPAHLHLEFEVRGDEASLRQALGQILEDTTSIAGVNCVIGFGASTWAALAPDSVPDELEPFVPIAGPDTEFPATQADLWIWYHGSGPGALFGTGRAAVGALRDVAKLTHENWGFAYGASQDLTGFEDGTENPPLPEAVAVAAIPEGETGAGGSIVLLQRWRHDLDGFDAMDPAQQELVFGRTRVGSIELEPDLQSPNAHVERVVIEDDDGEELEVWRRSVPFGTLQEHGLVFLAFSADRARLQTMLERMAGVGDGVRDNILSFSTPTSGAWYFAPPVELLDSIL